MTVPETPNSATSACPEAFGDAIPSMRTWAVVPLASDI